MSAGPFSKQDHVQITTLGTEFAVAEILGVVVGFWLDNKWGTSPWMLVLGAIGGFLLGLYIILRAAKEMERQTKIQKVKKEDGRR